MIDLMRKLRPRFTLRTLLVLLAVLPPLLAVAWIWWGQAQPPPPEVEDDPYEIIWDDYASDVGPLKGQQP